MSDDDGVRYEGSLGNLRDSPWLSSLDIPHDRDTFVQIECLVKHDGVEFVQAGGRKEKKKGGSIAFVGKSKKLWLNATILKSLAAVFGNNAKACVGQWVALYVDPAVKVGGQVVPAVRLRARRVTPDEIKGAAVAPKTEQKPEPKPESAAETK